MSTQDQFAGKAVSAFERTYSALFTQAHTEVNRLERVNHAMGLLEQNLLDPDRIADMDPSQQIALAELLTRTSNSTIRNLMNFGELFMDIRSVVGLLDGVQKFTGPTLPQGVDNFPQLPDSSDHGGDDFTDI